MDCTSGLGEQVAILMSVRWPSSLSQRQTFPVNTRHQRGKSPSCAPKQTHGIKQNRQKIPYPYRQPKRKTQTPRIMSFVTHSQSAKRQSRSLKKLFKTSTQDQPRKPLPPVWKVT